MKKKENILINGCSRGLGYDFFVNLKSNFNVYGLSSIKNKNKNIFYFNPLEESNLNSETAKKLNKIRIDHVIHCSGGGFKKYNKLLDLKNLKDLFNVNFFSIYEVNKFLIKKKK